MLDRRESRRRAGNKQCGETVLDLFFFEMLADFGGDIDDVAEPGCRSR